MKDAPQTRNANRPLGNAIHVLGWAALAACLALSSPGVTIARAGEPLDASSEIERFESFHADSSQDAPTVDPAATCSAGAGAAAQQLAAADALLQLQRQLAAQAEALRAAGGDPGQGVVMLNGRGANYGSGADPNLDMRGVHLEQLRR